MGETSYQQSRGVLLALGLIGLALASGMTYVEVFPTQPRPVPRRPVTMPSGVSLDTTLNFSPRIVNITKGEAVQWTNKDDAPHTATATSYPTGAVKFDSGELDSRDSFTLVFDVAGTYRYHCSFHPGWMQGTIYVNP